jgi:hypothetical protein
MTITRLMRTTLMLVAMPKMAVMFVMLVIATSRHGGVHKAAALARRKCS